jgi:hypothetical protein
MNKMMCSENKQTRETGIITFVLARFLGIGKCNLTGMQKSFLIILLLIALVSLLISLQDTYKYGSVDMRGRVVGSRLFWNGYDPYKFEWHPGISDRLLAPSQKYLGYNKTPYPPTLLTIYGISAWLPYKVQQWLWFFFSWAAMVGSILILTRTMRAQKARYLFLVLAIIFFVTGYFWRLHVERGQYYIILVLLLSIGIYYESKADKSKLYCGMAFGLVASLRPTFILMLAFLWLFGRRSTASWMAATMVFIFSLTLVIGGLQPWISYFETVQVIEKSKFDSDFLLRQYGPPRIVPDVAEGVNMIERLPSRTVSVTFNKWLPIASRHLGIDLPFDLAALSKVGAMIFVFLAIGFAYFRNRQHVGIRFALVFSLAVVLDLEFFLPERHGYIDVMYLPMLALIVPLLYLKQTPKIILILVVLAFVIGHSIIPLVDSSGITTMLRSFIFMGTVTWIIVFMNPKQIVSDFNDNELSG